MDREKPIRAFVHTMFVVLIAASIALVALIFVALSRM